MEIRCKYTALSSNLALNSNLPQALNNIAVIYHSQALRAQTLEEGIC
jgi:hypothetical protein